MAYGLDEQTQFVPYQPDELMALEGLLQPQQGLAAEPPMAMPTTTPAVATEPVEPTAPAPVAAPPAQTPAPPIPPAPAPLPLGRPAQAARPPLPLAGVSVSGMPDAQRKQVLGAYQELAGQQTANAEQAGQTEAEILTKRMGAAQKRVEGANVEANKAQMALAGKQAARQKLEQEGAEWSKMKESPAQAFEGQEWAGVLASIGIAAGAFSNAMGWQNGNPVLDQFQRTVDRSIAAQREQKNSRLQEIAARIGDSHAAEQLLGAQLHDAIADRAAAEQEKAASQEAFDRLGTLVQAERQKSQEMLLGAYERTAQQEQRQYQMPGASSGKTEIEQLGDLLRVQSQLEEGGYTPDNPIMTAIQSRIDQLAPQGESKMAYQRRQDAAKQAKEARPSDPEMRASAANETITALGEAAGLKRDVNTGKWVQDDETVNTLGLGEDLKGLFGRPTPVRDALQAAVEAYGRFQSGGAIGDEEREAFTSLLGGDTQSRQQLASRLNAAERTIRARLPESQQKSHEGIPNQWK